MQCYIVSIIDIEKCNKNNIVACWSDEYNCAIVVVNEQSKLIFDGHGIVEINEQQDSEG